VQEDVDDDILTEQYIFSQSPHRRQKRIGYHIGYCTVRPTTTSSWGSGRSADNWALDTLLKRASKPNKKITAFSRLLHSVFLYNVNGITGENLTCFDLLLY
jgi:hypothetical protein